MIVSPSSVAAPDPDGILLVDLVVEVVEQSEVKEEEILSS